MCVIVTLTQLFESQSPRYIDASWSISVDIFRHHFNHCFVVTKNNVIDVTFCIVLAKNEMNDSLFKKSS